jgi:hypothetical protein
MFTGAGEKLLEKVFCGDPIEDLPVRALVRTPS